jgi:outer membrane protein TolC
MESNQLKICIFLLFIFSFGNSLFASDSLKVFGPEAFFKVVQAFHPMAKQAELQLQKGQAEVLKSRGGFDPKVNLELNEKNFNSNNYFSLLRTDLMIPTWYGVEIKSSYEKNSGLYLNPENTTNDPGLISAGVSVSLLRGLATDQRRTALQQAKIYNTSTEVERKNMLNELLLQAGKAYWDWFVAYNQLETFSEAVRIAEERFEGVKQAAIYGDRPYVDTLESGIQLQERKLSKQQAELSFMNKTLMLSTFLWTEDDKSYELSPGVVPPNYLESGIEIQSFAALKDNLDSLLLMHPQIRLSMYKIDRLILEKRLKAEQLKPQLNLSYQPILSDVGNVWAPNMYANNYKWGVGFNMPIFLRKERGDLTLMQLKIKESELELESKTNVLYMKSQAMLNEFENTLSQVNLYTRTVGEYRALLEAEKEIFNVGESSLFLINAREVSYINARIKLIDLISKNQIAFITTQYAMGVLGQ